MSDSLLDLFKTEIRELSAYHVADATGLVKLDAMENPYPLPDELRSALSEALSGASLNRYPDPSAKKLRERLRRVMGVPSSRSIILGNGSDELIQMLVMAVANPERCVMSVEPSFVMYEMVAKFVGTPYVGVPLTSKFEIDLDLMRKSIRQNDPAVIFIAYPNNPTGNCFSLQDIEEIIELSSGLVVIDEAYQPFAQKSVMSLLDKYDRLMVMRTVSKMGLAGIRLGLLCGRKDLIDELDKIRLPYNINVMTQVAADIILEHVDLLEDQARMIRESRAKLSEQLDAIEGIERFHSDANFILFKVESRAATDVYDSIKEQGVLIKNMGAVTGPLANCLRVTVGKPEENEKFIEALKAALSM